jgi:hypothetical protein
MTPLPRWIIAFVLLAVCGLPFAYVEMTGRPGMEAVWALAQIAGLLVVAYAIFMILNRTFGA